MNNRVTFEIAGIGKRMSGKYDKKTQAITIYHN